MVRALKYPLVILGCLAIGCAGALSLPRVVTVVEPYTPILPLDEGRNPGLDGRVMCDLVGMPVIYIRTTLADSVGPWVLLHEKVHVEQALGMKGGCIALRQRISSDSMFRLKIEGAAFCHVYSTELLTGHKPHESYQSMFWVLSNKYQAEYDSVSVATALLPCHG